MPHSPTKALLGLRESLHLDEEELVLLATGEALDEALQHHAQHCARCAERLSAARDLLPLEPFHRQPDLGRVERLMQRLTEAGAVPAEAPPLGHVRLVFEGSAIRVLDTDAQIRIGPALATRRADASEAPSGVTFFRRLGPVQVELHLVRVPCGNFHLVVGARCEEGQDELRVVLRRGRRELAASPVPQGTATFKDLRPGLGLYALDVHRRGLRVGTIDLEVSAQGDEVPR